MTKLSKLLMTLGIGAGAMYFYDPQLGRRRRAVVRDQLQSTWSGFGDDLDTATRDLQNRARGLVTETRGRLRGEQPDDSTLQERVRSSMGWAVSHPRAVQVEAREGQVTLRGPILASEVDTLLATVARVRGVRSVDNQLDVHQEPGNIPDLQGDPEEHWRQMRAMRSTWAPGPRLLASVAGGTLVLGGLVRGGLMGTARTMVGAGLLARALTNRPLSRLVRMDGDGEPGAIDIHKGIIIDAPVDEVFRFWANYQNFSRFMANVEEVRDLGDGRSHWVVKGPAGTLVEWDARVTAWEPDRLISWRSEPGSEVGQVGTVRFNPAPGGGTEVQVSMSYTPPGGPAGHAVASLLGKNPKQQMDEDLARMKSLLEHGKTSTGAGRVTLRDVEAGE
jgi:uncharacterized membrane protein